MKSDENMNLETQTKLFGMSEAMKQGMNLGLELGEKAAGEKGTVGTASFRMPEDKKKNLKETLLLYAVTDRRWTVEKTLLQQVEEAILGGATFIQLREKDLGESAFEKEAVEIQELCRKYAVPFVVNDNVEIAKRMGADGVHVGQSDMEAGDVRAMLGPDAILGSDMEAGDVRAMLGPDAILGVSASTVEQAILAEKRGADYLGVGAVFPTGSKDDAVEVPHETLKAICEAVSIPVIAIGGISAENVHELSGSGICGIAVISAIFGQKDIKAATADLKKKTLEMVGK